MRWLTLLLLSLTITVSAHAEPFGLSLLGMCNKTWDCKGTVRAFRQEEVIRFGYLAQSFGAECPCVRKLLQDKRPKVVRIHLSNSTCFPERGRTCSPYEVFAGESIASADAKVRARDPRLMSRFRYVAATVRDALGEAIRTKCYVSPCLECNLSPEARTELLKVAVEMLPQCRMVDNPMQGDCLPGTICERHGSLPRYYRPCGADTDGDDYRGLDILTLGSRANKCAYTHLWRPEFNCLRPSGRGASSPSAPRLRSCPPLPSSDLSKTLRLSRALP